MNKATFPGIRKKTDFSKINSILDYVTILRQPQRQKKIQDDYVLEQAQIILKHLPAELEKNIENLCSLIGEQSLQGQIQFFERAHLFARLNPFAKIEIWAQDLQAPEEKCKEKIKGFLAYENTIKESGKINILEKYVSELSTQQNITCATNNRELSKNLISYGGLGIVAYNVKINGVCADISISANPMTHADPIWNKGRWRNGGESADEQHNFLVNQFDKKTALAITENKLYACNAQLIKTTSEGNIKTYLRKKIAKAKKIAIPEPFAQIKKQDIQTIENNIREVEFSEPIFNGTLIMYFNK